MGSYKEHIYSRSLPYRNCQSAQPQVGEIESRSSPDVQLCTAVNGVQMQSEFYEILRRGSETAVCCKPKMSNLGNFTDTIVRSSELEMEYIRMYNAHKREFSPRR